uniref:SLC3A2_N domain-containing protein n=1 Tax=Bursaphelenchus xylophilus TaxID=6326 RepID=A0A1I7SK66_BURXY
NCPQMSTGAQLWALAAKDLRITARSKKRCCCEILVPCFVLPIIIGGLIASQNFDKLIQPNSVTLDLSLDGLDQVEVK